MNIEKIEINGHYVWVDKDSLEAKTYLFWDVSFGYKIVTQDYEQNIGAGCYKIIAASPELNLEGVPTYVEWLAEKEYPNEKGGSMWIPSSFDLDQSKRQSGFIKGYQTRDEELLGDDMCYHECPSCNIRCNCSTQPCSCCNEPLPTWDDVRKAIELSKEVVKFPHIGFNSRYTTEEIIEQLKNKIT